MDRTIIAPYRAEEKELSRILYNTIQGLILIHPPTEDLRKCLSDEMFIKPNQQAFFHVMHYLFRLLDPQEFKKRFFWPITDKRSESNFRTSTVEYLKYINEKHQLNWTNIKSYLVVIPGGMKFISFLLDFVNFIVHELVKQIEKQLNVDADNYRSQVSEANVHKMGAKNEVFKGFVSNFIDAIENLNMKYDDMTRKLIKQLEILSQESGLSVDLLTDEEFIESFEEQNNQLFEKCYGDRSVKVLEMEKLIFQMKEAMDKFCSKEVGYKYDEQRICQQLKRIREDFSIDEMEEAASIDSKVTNEGVNINTLISTFNVINETIQNELKTFNKTPLVGEFVYSRLINLKKEFQEMEMQITNFKKMLYENINKLKTEGPKTPISADVNGQTKLNLENTLLMKLVSTPPIKFELPEGGHKSRLALVDSKGANANETTFNNFLAPPQISTLRQPNRRHSLVDQSISDLNNSISRSKLIDPIHLLRSTSKKDSSKSNITAVSANISSLSTNWKQRQTILNDNCEDASTVTNALSIDDKPKTNFKLFVTDKTSPQSFTKTASNTMLHQSDFTSFDSNDHTKIARSQYQLDSSVIGGDSSSAPPTLNYVKKLSAVRKVQDASLNFSNLSTSPSGRLEPLVTAEDLDIPKIKLNDISLMEQHLSLNNSFVYENPKPLLNPSIKNVSVNDDDDDKFHSNNPNNKKSDTKDEQEEEDALCNISDSVLKDVPL